MKKLILSFFLLSLLLPAVAQQYENFKVSIYCTVYNVDQMSDVEYYLKPKWKEITRQLKVDKVYLETHRDMRMIEQDKLDRVKKFFLDEGIEISGGITYTIEEKNNFQTFCYNDPEHRKKVKEIAEFTARNFDQFILDDFFFTSCKSDGAIMDKGERSWSEYRVELMTEAAQSLVIDPARRVNPNVKIVIKYPNWYEHFQGCGFNLEKQPKMFDGIYTGTETRDAVISDQHLQPYLGYNIFRYFENISPGKNGGGWIDPFGMGVYDRYAEQLWITAFAGAPEITLFNFGELLNPIDPGFKSQWQLQNTSFNYNKMMKPVNYNKGKSVSPSILARVAGYALETADKAVSYTGTPYGIKTYKPFHSVGEDFLQNYLGMIGLPMDQVSEFPGGEEIIILTETATFDPDIVEEIKNQLHKGKNVVITSGFLRIMQDKGLNDIVELRYTDRKSIVKDYTIGWRTLVHGEKQVLINQINYLTNDSWEIVSGLSGDNGWPVLHMADYSKGKLFILTIPDNFADLYHMPAKVLNEIRKVICTDLDIYLEAPAKVVIYLYDNNTFIVQSFVDEPVEFNIVAGNAVKKIIDLTSNIEIKPVAPKPAGRWDSGTELNKDILPEIIPPHSFRIFRYEK